jgi:hypothetical protein
VENLCLHLRARRESDRKPGRHIATYQADV